MPVPLPVPDLPVGDPSPHADAGGRPQAFSRASLRSLFGHGHGHGHGHEKDAGTPEPLETSAEFHH